MSAEETIKTIQDSLKPKPDVDRSISVDQLLSELDADLKEAKAANAEMAALKREFTVKAEKDNAQLRRAIDLLTDELALNNKLRREVLNLIKDKVQRL